MEDNYFDNLSFEEQMKFETTRRGLNILCDNFDTFATLISEHICLLYEIINAETDEDFNKKLFCAAERMEAVKEFPEIKTLYHEWAREYDYIRHVYKERGLDAASMAALAVQETSSGHHDKAETLAKALNCHNSELQAIITYWKVSV